MRLPGSGALCPRLASIVVVAIGPRDLDPKVGAGVAAQHIILFGQDRLATKAPCLDGGAVTRDA